MRTFAPAFSACCTRLVLKPSLSTPSVASKPRTSSSMSLVAAETVATAAAAEADAFAALMTAELGHDVFTPLAFSALATERIELTPSIAVAFPRSPTVTASQAWDLHANSNGRFVLGLGSQVKGHNERRFGIPWSAPAPRLRDYVRALRAVWHCWETGGKLG